MVSNETLKIILTTIEKSENPYQVVRNLGYLEGILQERNILIPGQTINYKDITYIQVGWLLKEKTKTRKQTYKEFIIEKTKELINE